MDLLRKINWEVTFGYEALPIFPFIIHYEIRAPKRGMEKTASVLAAVSLIQELAPSPTVWNGLEVRTSRQRSRLRTLLTKQ